MRSDKHDGLEWLTRGKLLFGVFLVKLDKLLEGVNLGVVYVCKIVLQNTLERCG